MSRRAITTAKLRKEHGLTLPMVRSLDEKGLLSLTMTGKKSGFVWSDDFERFQAERHDRSRQAAARRQLEREALSGKGEKSRDYDFLRLSS